MTNDSEMNASSAEDETSQGLASRALLDKVDKLRELGISHLVPLSQVSHQEVMHQTKPSIY